MKIPLHKIGLFLILVVAPVFFTTAMRDIFTISKALPLSLGALLLWLAATKDGSNIKDRALTPGIAALMGVALLSTLLTVDVPLSILGPHAGQFHALLPMTLYVLIYYGAAQVTGDSSSYFIDMALLGGVLVCIPAISQINNTAYTFMPWSIQGGRAGSTFGSPIFLGSYLAMLLPLAWARMTKELPGNRPLYGAALIVIAVSLLATRSRGALLAGAMGIVLVDLMKGKTERAIGLSILALLALDLNFKMRGHNGFQADLGRIEIWRSGLRAFLRHPVLGWGPDTFGIAFRKFMTPAFVSAEGNDISIQMSAHNDLIQAMTTMGLAGLAAYVYFLGGVVRNLKRALSFDSCACGIAGAMLAVFINAKFNPVTMTTLAVAACLLGSLGWYLVPHDAQFRRSHAWAISGVALAVFGVFFLVAKAESQQRMGENLWQEGRPIEAAEQFNQAAITNPFDLWYTQRQMDYFWKVIGKLPGTNKEILAAFSHNVSENIGRLHPADPTAHELRSISYEFEGEMIGRDRLWEAFNEMAVAERLAPHFTSYSRRRACLMMRAKKKSPRPCFDQGPERAARS